MNFDFLAVNPIPLLGGTPMCLMARLADRLAVLFLLWGMAPRRRCALPSCRLTARWGMSNRYF
ncbi:hypothetical protein [Nitrosococcus wardiae]|uniref:Uncharacterized protein n=1 Tax=Nitrosococcus wardiae TaxID=1814290 RepID=A0A4P7BW62_9GAMM|nr:hypothetical protein [Nitrosococcus wardiae]QBQ53324.1 hypothetical protein E3U44_01465 [Nitrosococcus wardiae]